MLTEADSWPVSRDTAGKSAEAGCPGPPGTKKKLALVPFRHSKLTEIFQNFFIGDGRAVSLGDAALVKDTAHQQVMIVNVNPYDTGFDENSHVMRFSAIAREVQTTAQNKVTSPVNPSNVRSPRSYQHSSRL